MRYFLILLALSGCNRYLVADCELKLQITDSPVAASKYRARDVCAKVGYEGTLEKTKCHSATPLDKDNLPAECR